MDWRVISGYIFSRNVLEGVAVTILLSVFAQAFGSLVGLGLYFARRSRFLVLRRFTDAYIWFFRGTPLIVQIVVIWQLLVYIPFFGTSLGSFLDNRIDVTKSLGLANFYFLSGVLGSLLALSLNEGAYMAEIVRAGIDSIDVGQIEAAKSLGMTYGQAMRRVVLPQALRVIIPPLGNEFNSMLKSSSLASAAGVVELFYVTSVPGRSTSFYLSFMVVAVIWYLFLTSVWGLVQSNIERRLNASNIDPALSERGTWWNRITGIGVRTNRAEPEPGAPIPAGAERGAR